MLRKALPVTWEVNYNDKEIFNNKEVNQHELSVVS
jgi:hypothetical protein